jgi:RNA polymerase sigma-70 factor (ECF subfamily)
MAETRIDEAARLEAFLADKARLTRLAYRYLGSVSDAEDMVQESWLRFARVEVVEDPKRLLATIVTRLCLDRLKSAQVQRETYVGPWLPEPVLETDNGFADEAALDISYAVMRVLERLSPAERAAFFLHDLWDISFDEIAETLQRSPEACRKLASRARTSLMQERQRFRPTPADLDRFLATFRQAAVTGDVSGLQALFARDAEYISDSGGNVPAALNILKGNETIARFLLGIAAKLGPRINFRADHALINGAPGLILHIDGTPDQTMAFDLDEAGRLLHVYAVRNPDKLRHLQEMQRI